MFPSLLENVAPIFYDIVPHTVWLRLIRGKKLGQYKLEEPLIVFSV